MDWGKYLEQLSDFNVQVGEQTGLVLWGLAMLMSLLSALFASYLYGVFYQTRSAGSSIHRAFPLLGISITAIFISIQFSLPLSLGLLGALSIVRFRTPIKEPEEVAFIMLVVATSLCCAALNILFLTIILTSAVTALVVMSRVVGRRRPAGHGLIIVRMPGSSDEASQDSMIALLARELPMGGMDSVTQDDAGMCLSYRFSGLAENRVGGLRTAVKGAAAGGSCDIYFDRPGAS